MLQHKLVEEANRHQKETMALKRGQAEEVEKLRLQISEKETNNDRLKEEHEQVRAWGSAPGVDRSGGGRQPIGGARAGEGRGSRTRCGPVGRGATTCWRGTHG